MLSFYLFVSIVTAKSMETFVTLYPVSSLKKSKIKERFSLLIVITIFFSSWCMQYYKYVREIPFALTGSLGLAKATAEGKI